MPTGLLPDAAAPGATATDPQAVAEAFLAALAAEDLDAAASLLAEDVRYTNVGLPTIRGRRRVVDILRGLQRPSMSFEVYLHSIAVDGSSVLTERTDVIVVGPLRAQFWVWGRFDVDDGRITVWRDSFDYLDVARSLVRGAIGIVVPGLRPLPPQPGAEPGR